ncbi:MAG TPA: hypothetical protein PKK43_00735 [Spirochaetota bacterium]|nr:hypothetical protein [Spirochaetota bacterium]
MVEAKNPVVVFEGDSIKAMKVYGTLEENGIDVLSGSDMNDMFSHNTIQIAVNEEDRDKAAAIIDQMTMDENSESSGNDDERMKSSPDSFFYICFMIISSCIGYYSGIHLLVPYAFFFVMAFISNKVIFPEKKPALMWTGIFLFTQFFTLLLGLLMISYQKTYIEQNVIIGTWIEVFVYLALGILLYAIPNIITGMIVLVIGISGLIVNTLGLLSLEIGSADHKAVLTMFILRVLVITSASISLRRLFKERSLSKSGDVRDRPA